MKKLATLLFCLTLAQAIFGQTTQRSVLRYPDLAFCGEECPPLSALYQGKDSDWRKKHPGSFYYQNALPDTSREPFLAVSVVWFSKVWHPASQLHFIPKSWEANGTPHFEPIKLTEDPHAGKIEGRQVSNLIFLKPGYTHFSLWYVGAEEIDSIAIHFFHPGKTDLSALAGNPKSQIPNPKSLICACPQPDYQSRQDWCPSGNCPADPSPTPTSPTHLIVHHSAGSNIASDWAAVVRSIWDFHVNVNGWDDIGYNWLVAPTGVLYEGRGNDVLGAHFCGYNGKTMGVCMMGDYTDLQPPTAAVGTLEHLLAWKACDKDIDPLGTSYHSSSALNLNNISGHRDGCATACPGDNFYPTLQQVRDAVQSIIGNECDGNSVSAPTTLTADAISGTQVDLEWTDNSTNEEGFLLERSSPSNSNYQQVAELPANTTTYSDLSVLFGNGYFYRVKAVTGDVESGFSNEVYVSTNVNADASALDERAVRIFPNPTSGQATFFVENQWVGTMNVTVFDALGRVAMPLFSVEKPAGAATFSLDMSALPAGVFMVKIEQGGGVGFFKLEKH